MSQGLCLAHNGIADVSDVKSILGRIDFSKLNNVFGPCQKNAKWVKSSWRRMGLSEEFDCDCFWYGNFSYINVLINRDFYNWSFPVEWENFSSNLTMMSQILDVLSVIDTPLKSDVFIFHSGSGNRLGEKIQNCFFNGHTFPELLNEIKPQTKYVSRPLRSS
jgi:hypothetical protein